MRGSVCPTPGACQRLSESKYPLVSLDPPLYIFLSKSPVSHQALGPWGPHSLPSTSSLLLTPPIPTGGEMGTSSSWLGGLVDRILGWMREGEDVPLRCLSAGLSAMGSLWNLQSRLPYLQNGDGTCSVPRDKKLCSVRPPSPRGPLQIATEPPHP